MGNSLQEQLLKAGLVNTQQIKEARAEKRQQHRQTGPRGPRPEQAARAEAERVRHEQLERDRALNRQRQEEAARRAAEHELRQLIHAHRVIRDRGDLAFNFTDGNKLKRIYVDRQQHAGLVAGQLAVVRQDAFYELIPAAIAERVRARDPSLILVHNKPDSGANPDDPYAEYQVPDDLMW